VTDKYFTEKKIRSIRDWIYKQRYYKRKGVLSRDKEEILNSFGFDWTKPFKGWYTMFSELKNNIEKYGNFYKKKINEELKTWIMVQRRNFKIKKISNNKIKKLKSIGIILDPQKTQWEEKLKRLIEYKNKNGHCNVPKTYKNYGLGLWCFVNRKRYKKGILYKERIEKLIKIGFDFKMHNYHFISSDLQINAGE
jgi:hypothetical protein